MHRTPTMDRQPRPAGRLPHRGRRRGEPCSAQRYGQDHTHPFDRRLHAGGRRVRFKGDDIRRWAALPDHRARDGAGAPGPPHLPLPSASARTSTSRGPSAPAAGRSSGSSRCFRVSANAPAMPGKKLSGGEQQDAGDRSRAHEQPRPGPDGRADRGPGAAPRARGRRGSRAEARGPVDPARGAEPGLALSWPIACTS